jgi:polyphosphate kinase
LRMKNDKLNREISWLSFNERVLQEAEDKSNPLIERMHFLGIYSNNSDEFFRVRVATVRRLIKIQKKVRLVSHESPQKVMNKIYSTVVTHRKRFSQIYKGLLTELADENIVIVNESNITEEQLGFVTQYFNDKVEPALVPLILRKNKSFPYLKDDTIYLFVVLDTPADSELMALIEFPRKNFSRFIQLPSADSKDYLIYLDDIIRLNLRKIFKIFEYTKIESYIVKLTRDAELDIDDDVVQGFYDKIKKSLKQRKVGEPVRFIYDSDMPQQYVDLLLNKMNLKDEENIIPGGRYHNFKDFMKFPSFGREHLVFQKKQQLKHKHLEKYSSLLQCVNKRDILLHYPYQSFDYIIDMLREAAISPEVTEIKMSLYRLAKDSKIVNALVNAAKNGKAVTVVIELQARFDEVANLEWAKVFNEEGVKMLLGPEGLKVHSKLLSIKTKRKSHIQDVVHVGTGNFHEGTATVYSDVSLLTSNPELVQEVEDVFEFVEKPYTRFKFQHLLVSPHSTRSSFMELIQEQIIKAKNGGNGYMMLKMNSLVDEGLIDCLYEASREGVKIDLLVRGICRLIPQEPGMSENIHAKSIVGKYLEHTRVYIFGLGNDKKVFISSADWMTRNLDRRIEVTVPIHDEKLKAELYDFLRIQWKDNTKARILDKRMTNTYAKKEGKTFAAQEEFYEYLKKKYDR